MKTIYFKQALATMAMLLAATVSYADEATKEYDAKIDGIYYNLVPKAKLATVTYGAFEGKWGPVLASYSGSVTIPESFEYEGVIYKVVAIGDRAFENSHNLTSVTLPNSITKIDFRAFYGCI